MGIDSMIELSEGLLNLSEVDVQIKQQVRSDYLNSIVSTITHPAHKHCDNEQKTKIGLVIGRINYLYGMSVSPA